MPRKLRLIRRIRSHRRTPQRSFWAGVLTVVFVIGLAAALLRPVPAQAQFGGIVSDVGAGVQRVARNIIDAARWVYDNTNKIIDKVSKRVGDVAFKNGLRVFLGKIAEDTATWVASAGTGQKPLFITDGNYFADLGQAAAGDYLDSLAKEQFGVSLCDPGTYKLQLDIAIRTNLDPNFCQTNCQKNYDDTMKSGVVEVNKTDLVSSRIYPDAKVALENLVAQKNQGKTSSSDACNPTIPIDSCITYWQEAITTFEATAASDLQKCLKACREFVPGQSIGGQQRRIASCSLAKIQENLKGTTVSGSLSVTGAGGARATIGTFAARADALQQAFKDGELPKIFQPSQNPLGQFLSVSQAAQEAAAEKERQEKNLIEFGVTLPLRSLISGKVKTPSSITTSAAQEGLSTQGAASSETTQTGSPLADAFGVFTKTLTSKLIERIFSKGLIDDKGNPNSNFSGNIGSVTGGTQAARDRFASLSQVSFGSGGGVDVLTELSSCPVDVATTSQTSLGVVSPNNCVLDTSFRQAIEERLTVKEALARGLLSDQRVFGFDANGREPDYRNGYPYRSLIIMRKYRIIPVGWELAAEYIRDYEKQNVNIRTLVEKFDDPSPDNPYYRLIDPSWVLKAPENICLRSGYTNQVVSEEFVDDDGDEAGRKNIDYSKRYCNSDSDANINKECTCDDATIANQFDKSVATCVSTYNSSSNPTVPRDKCADANGNPNPKATCAYITPRVRQVQRLEGCVDERSCILENDDGTCKQFGTCTEEEDIWRFNGQSCNAQYASCQTYTSPTGQQVSYVKNSLQPSVCGPDNAGCQQYCTAMDYATGKWACTNTDSGLMRRYDKDVEACDASAEGCTELIRMTRGTNIVHNSSFEESTVVNVANNVNFSGWLAGNATHTCGAQSFAVTDAVSGSQAARIQWAPDCVPGDPSHWFAENSDTGEPVGGKAFTLSFYAKADGAAACPVVVHMISGTGASAEYGGPASVEISPTWQRYSFSHTYADTLTSTNIEVTFRPNSSCSYILDAVQVEEGSQLTDYKDYGTVNQVHLKLPPMGVCSNNTTKHCAVNADCGAGTCLDNYNGSSNLKCTGNPASDPPACANFAQRCTANDAGCDLFTPLAGGQSIPAQPGISCPADKVGCASFREQPTTGVLAQHATRTGMYCRSTMATEMRSCASDADCSGGAGDCQPLVSFIGNTGQSCTAQDVGCEAFTNLDEVAQGGEGKAQFTKLQLCVAPGYTGNLADYFSWVGDNESGYQLKKYRLVLSDVPGGAPCTNLNTTTLACNDAANTVINCSADFGTNPDCGQYYDGSGQTHYRLRSRVIQQTESCHPFRNAVDNQTYYADSTLSTSCSQAAVGCREYVGNTGNNTRAILTSDFERGSYAPWTTSNAGNPSTESVNYGGHSLFVAGSNSASADLSGALQQGKSYTVQFWGKSSGASTQVNFSLQAPGSPVSLGSATLTSEWNVYTLGPAQITFSPSGVHQLIAAGGTSFYLDNVVLTELTDNLYRIKNSQTACGGFEGCQTYRNRNGELANYQSFTKLCQMDKVGCERVIHTQNSTTAASRTIDLPNLRGDVDGSGKIDLQDLDYLLGYFVGGGPPPFVFESGDVNVSGSINIADIQLLGQHVRNGAPLPSGPYPNDSVTTSKDVVEYWVNDPAKACQAADKGCRAFGKQTIGMEAGGNKKLLDTETVYLRDNPDTYPNTLCGKEALFCDAFGTSDGGTAYFRDPSNRTCSYREASGGNPAGWYVDGTTNLCPTRAPNGIPPAVPSGGFAGNCPGDQNGCSMFLDPIGTGESLAFNGGFEVGNPEPQGWTSNYCQNDSALTCVTPAASSPDCGGSACIAGNSMQAFNTYGGSYAVRLLSRGSQRFRQTVPVQANTYYVLSADVQRGNESNTPTLEDVRLGVVNCKDAGGDPVRATTPDSTGFADTFTTYLDIPAENFDTSVWRRVSMRFYTNTAANCQIFLGSDGGTAGHWFDQVQLHMTTATPVLHQSVDSTSCNGQAGDKLGCRLFNDYSNTSLTYDADLTPIGGSPDDPDSSGSVAPCNGVEQICDSNVLLKVRRDRACSQWIAPSATYESTKANGAKENLTVGVGTCDSLSPGGQCDHFVDEYRCSNNPKNTCIVNEDCGTGATCQLFSITGDAPTPIPAYTRENLRNKSGYTLAGMRWVEGTLQGKYPLGSAPQIGSDGIAVTDETLHSTFEDVKTINASGWSLSTVDAAESSGTTQTSLDDTKLRIITEDVIDATGGKAPTVANQRLEVTPSLGGTPVILRTAANTLANKLSPSRTYMLAFDVRYTITPRTSLTDQQKRITAGISSGTDPANYTRPDYAWQGTVVPTTEWQRFVVGPLELSDGNCSDDICSTLAEGNTSGATHFSLDTLTAFAFFSPDPANRTPFAIDNVSLLPALAVSEPTPASSSGIVGQLDGDAYIARSCRAFPEASALTCSYQDDTGKKFQGWQGYCLERDPRNPNTCLTWYPLDLLAGERNIFGKVEAAGYSGPVPLYICAQEGSRAASGSSYLRTSSVNINNESGDANTAVTRVTSPYPQSQIESVIVRVTGRSDDQWSPVGTALTATRVEGEYLCQSGANCTPWSSGTEGRTREPWYVAWCGGIAGNDHMDCNKNAILDSWANIQSGVTDDNTCNNWESSEDTNFWGVRLEWVGSDSRELDVRFGKCDSTGGEGGVRITLDFIPREMCTLVAEVADVNGNTTGWAQRLNNVSRLPNFDYFQTHDAAPFGRIIPPEENFDDPTQWDTSTSEAGKQALSVTLSESGVRANAAFSCPGGNCQPRTCSQTGNECSSVGGIAACKAAGGVCIGSGPTKQCQNDTRTTGCVVDTDCRDPNPANPFIPNTCSYGPFVTRGGGVYSTARRTNTNLPVRHLELLFANVFNVYQLDTTNTTQNYTATTATACTDNVNCTGCANLISTWQCHYRNMRVCSGAINRAYYNFPSGAAENQILAGNAYCGVVPEVKNVAINAGNQTRVIISDGEVIQLKFNTYVDAEQLPLKNIAIDWNGDISTSSDQQIIPWGFAPRGDQADPHIVTHVYRMGRDFAGTNGRCFDPNNGPYANLAGVQGKSYCVATPKIQAQDNWEWCNYNGGSPNNARCLSSVYPVVSSNDNWTQFNGDVIVVR